MTRGKTCFLTVALVAVFVIGVTCSYAGNHNGRHKDGHKAFNKSHSAPPAETFKAFSNRGQTLKARSQTVNIYNAAPASGSCCAPSTPKANKSSSASPFKSAKMDGKSLSSAGTGFKAFKSDSHSSVAKNDGTKNAGTQGKTSFTLANGTKSTDKNSVGSKASKGSDQNSVARFASLKGDGHNSYGSSGRGDAFRGTNRFGMNSFHPGWGFNRFASFGGRHFGEHHFQAFHHRHQGHHYAFGKDRGNDPGFLARSIFMAGVRYGEKLAMAGMKVGEQIAMNDNSTTGKADKTDKTSKTDKTKTTGATTTKDSSKSTSVKPGSTTPTTTATTSTPTSVTAHATSVDRTQGKHKKSSGGSDTETTPVSGTTTPVTES
jgi:hypothetical protein